MSARLRLPTKIKTVSVLEQELKQPSPPTIFVIF